MLFAGNLIKHLCFDEMRATGKGFRVIPAEIWLRPLILQLEEGCLHKY